MGKIFRSANPVTAGAVTQVAGPEVVFSLPGSVASSTSGRYIARTALTFSSVYVNVVAAGAATTTVTVLLDSATVATVVLAPNALEASAVFSLRMNAGQHLQAAVSLSGTGAPMDLVVQVNS